MKIRAFATKLRAMSLLLACCMLLACAVNALATGDGVTRISVTRSEFDAYSERAYAVMDAFYQRWLEDGYGKDEYPEYFAGYDMLSGGTGKMTMFITDDSPAVTQEVQEVAGDFLSEMNVEKVRYSMNELRAAVDYINDNYKVISYQHMRISNINNKVYIYWETPLSSAELSEDMAAVLKSDIYRVEDFGSMEDYSREGSYKNGVVRFDFVVTENDLSASPDVPPLSRIITNYYGGMTTYKEGSGGAYSVSFGTTSFSATNSSGQRLLFTHGHGVAQYGSTLGVNGQTHTFTVLGVGDTNDASYTVLGSNTAIYNLIGTTGYKIMGTKTNSELVSSGTILASFYGQSSAQVKSLTMYAENAGGGGEILMPLQQPTDQYCSHGDSGGPIFISGSGNGKYLIGTVKKSDTQTWMTGVTIENICEAYEDATDYSISVYTSNTAY